MSDIITTLHPENDAETNLYPNIIKENIPNRSIDLNKLDESVISFMGTLKPSGVDTSSNILAFTENKGIYIASDNGHWYYWNDSQYVDGGVYQATEIVDGSITAAKINQQLFRKIFNFFTIDFISKQDGYAISNTGNIIVYGSASLYKYDVSDYYFISLDGTLYAPNNQYSHYLFLDSSNNVIEYVSPASTSEHTKDYATIVNIPDNAKYLYICVVSGDVDFCKNLITNSVNSLTLLASQNILDLSLNLKDIAYVSKQDGYAISNTGNTIVYGSASLYKCNVENLPFIRLNCTLYAPNNQYSHYLFLDSSNNVIEYVAPGSSATYTKNYDLYITVPTNAVYMYLCVVSGTFKTIYKDTYELDNSIEELSNGLNEMVYQDFTELPDGAFTNGETIATGQNASISGAAANFCIISNGVFTNNDGNFYLSVNRSNVKYISLSFGNRNAFKTSVIMLQVGNNLNEMIHLEINSNMVRLTYRIPSDTVFHNDFISVYGSPNFTTMDLNKTYNVKMWVKNDMLYVIKPDGELFITRSPYFNKTYTYATWQIYNSNGNGYFTKISAGEKYSDSCYEIAQKIKNL